MNQSSKIPRLTSLFIISSLLIIISTSAQVKSTDFIVGDALPDAPALAPRGSYPIGVQTLEVINKGQIDILKSIKKVTNITLLQNYIQKLVRFCAYYRIKSHAPPLV